MHCSYRQLGHKDHSTSVWCKEKTKGPKKKPENANDNTSDNNANDKLNNKEVTELVDNEEDITSLAEGLDREEQEVADDEDNEMSENVAVDLEEIEEALKEEVWEVGKKVKPIQHLLFKVRWFTTALILQFFILAHSKSLHC